MIASKLILFVCFCLLLLDNSLGQENKSILKRDKFMKLLNEAIEDGETYGGQLKKLTLKYNNLQKEIDQAKQGVGTSQVEIARFDELTKGVTDAQETVQYYEDLYNKTPTSEYKEKLDEAKQNHSDKVAALVAILSQDMSYDKNNIKKLQEKQDNVAISMIARMGKAKENLKRKIVRQARKEAKKNGLTDVDLKKILYADFFKASDVQLMHGGDSAEQALLASFEAGMKSIVDETYPEKLRIYQEGREEVGAPEGNGDDSKEEEEEVTLEEDDASEEDDAPEEDYTLEEDDAPEEEEVPEEDDGERDLTLPDAPGGNYSGDIDIYEQLGRRYPGLEGYRIENIEAWFFSNTPKGPPKFTYKEKLQANTNVHKHLNKVKVRRKRIIDKLRWLAKERKLGYYYEASLQATLNESHKEKLELYKRRAARIQSLKDTLESVNQDYNEYKDQYLEDFELTRENYEYYAVALGADPKIIWESGQLPDRSGDIDEFDDVEPEDERTRYLLSADRLRGLVYYGLLIDEINHDIQDERFYLQQQFNSLQDEIDALEEDGGDSEIPIDGSGDGLTNGFSDDESNDGVLLLEFRGLDDPVRMFEAKTFHSEDESGANTTPVPEVEPENLQLVTSAVNSNMERLMEQLVYTERLVDLFRADVTKTSSEGMELLKDPNDHDLTHPERVDLYNHHIERVETLLQKIISALNDAKRQHSSLFSDYKLARANTIYYGQYLNRDSSFFDLKRPAPLPEFTEFENDEKIRYFLSKERWARLHEFGPHLKQATIDLEEFKKFWEERLNKDKDNLSKETDSL